MRLHALRRFRPISGASLSLSALLLAGCMYGFAGGGLPEGIRTVAVLPFENLTSDPTLTSEINSAVREAVQDRLGLRQAGENQADALVRGIITRYEPDLPVSFTGNETTNQVNVTGRLVQIVVSVEIINRLEDRPLWRREGLVLEGAYETGREADGRRKALQNLITNIVEGAQSQW